MAEKWKDALLTKLTQKWGAEKGRLKCIKSIKCFGTDGALIDVFCSLIEASKKLHIGRVSISSSLIKGNWVKGEYLFKYANEYSQNKIEVGKINVQAIKRPIYFFLGNTVIEYESAQRASEELNVPKTSINRAALSNFGKPLRSGHIFIYKDLYEAKKAA